MMKTRQKQHRLFIVISVAMMIAMLLMPFATRNAAAATFVKGINMNGNAVTMDGNSWLAYSAAKGSGFSTTAAKTYGNSITWSPAADSSTSTMLNTVIYQSGASFTMTQTLANGTYDLYFWLTENYANNYRKVDIKLEGNTVASGVGSMAKNTWVKYGPYSVTVSDGVLNMDFVRISGDPQVAGLAIFTSGGVSATNTPVGPTATRTNTPVGPTPTAAATATQPVTPGRPRVIVLTDGEVDDRSSMIRFLMYTSDFDVSGIVQTNSKFQKNGHSGEKWLEAQLTQYEALLSRLRIHNPNYPSAASLRNVSKVGNENINDLNTAPPNMATKDTPGSQLIIDTLLDNDPRPVHVSVWGGANTVAYALWKLKTAYTPAQFQYAASRVRIYAIWYQDGGGQWIEDNIKEAYINEAYKWDNVWDYQSVSGSVNPAEVKAFMDSSWLNANVKTGHGALGAMTPQTYISEGDTPAFLHLINNGLLAYTDYTLGGWGGRSRYDDASKPNHVTDQSGVTDDGNANKPYWRWVIDTQNDFAARMDYCIAATYSAANHPPVANVVGSLTRTVAAGSTVTLDGSPTTDPDGNSLTYKWWQYYDADSASAKVTIVNSTAKSGASFVVPNEPGKQIHIILEVQDNGSPSLKSYRRIIFNIQ